MKRVTEGIIEWGWGKSERWDSQRGAMVNIGFLLQEGKREVIVGDRGRRKRYRFRKRRGLRREGEKLRQKKCIMFVLDETILM